MSNVIRLPPPEPTSAQATSAGRPTERTSRAPTADRGPWNERTLARLKEYVDAKAKSASEIADALQLEFTECAGISRGAVLGKCFRNDWTLDKPGGSNGGRRLGQARPRRNTKEPSLEKKAAAKAARAAIAQTRGIRGAKARKTATNAPGRPKKPGVAKVDIQKAASDVEAYHRKIVLGPIGKVHAPPELPEEIKALWQQSTPVQSALLPQPWCRYPTAYNPKTRQHFSCGVVKDPASHDYCYWHHILCKL